jgi:DNA polymerase/3'-5' exonuclease PolX
VFSANFKESEDITTDKISNLKLTDFMKSKALEVAEKGRFLDKKMSSKKEHSVETKSTLDSKLMSELMEIKGIGPERAKELMDNGLKHVKQLAMKKYYQTLGTETKAFIDLKPMKQIPNDIIRKFDEFIQQKFGKKYKLIITGSYRRQKTTSRDIDLMLVSDKKNSIDEFYNLLSSECQLFSYSKGLDKMSLIADITELIGHKNDKTRAVCKIDVFRVEPNDEIPMLLYSTGSKENNISMRSKAKKMGLLLNQKGLFEKKGESFIKIEHLNTEKDYYEALKMEYLEPVDR